MGLTGTAEVLQTQQGLESQEPIEKTRQSKPPWWACSFALGRIHKPHDHNDYAVSETHGGEDMAVSKATGMSSQQLVSGSHLDPSSPVTAPEVGDWILQVCWKKD